ncbi:hypothetical protein DPMN_047914 [Dreissena polymorpha]|uniref:Uncharacterized protein n=1 Tax=Dreissena polymorpha TaxID=45954 RepID=A0A9D4DAM1_DREPO|nr:hypothetical protein DPMN_047914 [Dreissena polymorpha]
MAFNVTQRESDPGHPPFDVRKQQLPLYLNSIGNSRSWFFLHRHWRRGSLFFLWRWTTKLG